MDFIVFEELTDSDAFASPQPSLMLPSTSNIKKLSAKINNFQEIKSLLEKNWNQTNGGESAETSLADKYASLSLSALENPTPKSEDLGMAETKPEKMVSDALSLRLGRALNPIASDTRMREIFTALDSRLANNNFVIDSGVGGSLARKHTRSNIELDLIKINELRLAGFAEPISRLRLIGEQVGVIQGVFSETNTLFDKDKKMITLIQDLVSQLDKKRSLFRLQKDLLSTFRRKFVLNEYDLFLLESREINFEFFEALKRAEKINEACSVLLALDDPSLAKTLMARSRTILEKSRENIRNFCRRVFRSTIHLSNRESIKQLHLCVINMSSDSEQLRLILDDLISSRAAAVLEDYSSQTTGKEHRDFPANQVSTIPVYYSSHDPIRFITDILAFSHASTANELELVSVLLDHEGRFDYEIKEVVSAIMSALATPIRAKIREMITLESKLSTLCHILSILNLYSVMFEKHIEAEVIASAVEDGIGLIREKIRVVLANQLSMSEESNSAKLDLSSDLQPPQWMTDYYSDIFIVIDSINSITLSGDSEERMKEFSKLILDRPIEIFENHLQSITTFFSEHEKILFRLNVFDLALSKMMPLGVSSEVVLKINHSINILSADAEDLQFKALVSKCALTDHYNVLNMICPMDSEISDVYVYQSVCESKIFKKDKILAIDEKVLSAVPAAILDFQSDLMKLNNPVIVNRVIVAASLRFVKFYTLFREVALRYISDSVITWSAEEVATLLGVESCNPS